MRLFQTLANHLCALVAARFLFLQKCAHCRMFYIDVQANDMNFVVFPDGRDLDTGDQIQRQPAAGNLARAAGMASVVS
jgi:hypothetical protein